MQIGLVVIKAELFSPHVEPTAWPGKMNGTRIDLVVITIGLSVHTLSPLSGRVRRTGQSRTFISEMLLCSLAVFIQLLFIFCVSVINNVHRGFCLLSDNSVSLSVCP